jgi:hypothetical protein
MLDIGGCFWYRGGMKTIKGFSEGVMDGSRKGHLAKPVAPGFILLLGMALGCLILFLGGCERVPVKDGGKKGAGEQLSEIQRTIILGRRVDDRAVRDIALLRYYLENRERLGDEEVYSIILEVWVDTVKGFIVSDWVGGTWRREGKVLRVEEAKLP